MKRMLLLLVVFSFISCSCGGVKTQEGKGESNSSGKADHLMGAVLWAQKSAEFKALYIQGYNIGKEKLDAALKKHKKKDKPLAIVLDVDETVLDNTPFEGQSVQNGVVFDNQLWNDWVKMEKAKALPGAKEFLQYAFDKKVAIFYVSNRDMGDEAKATFNNLKKEGFPDVALENFIFKEGKSSKEARRQKIAEKYNIVLFFGDNLIDFASTFETHDADKRDEAVLKNHRTDFGSRFIILPNPMYGDWLKPLNKEKKPLREQLQLMK